jgi:hypothetical protein
MKRSTLMSGGLALGFILATTVSAPAFAGPVEIVPWEDSDAVVHQVGDEDWCPPDVVDFVVSETWEGSGIDRITTQKDGLVRYAGTFSDTNTFTANDKTFVIYNHGNSRDTDIADNGDGTLTIWVKNSVKSTVWIDGEFLFHDSGLVEATIVVKAETGEFLYAIDDEFALHGRFDTADRWLCEDLAIYLGD